MSIVKMAGRRRWPTIDEVEPVIARLPGELEAFARVALWSGLRLSEVADLRRGDVEHNRDGTALVHVRAGKGNVEGWSLLYAPGRAALDVVTGLGHEGVLLRNSQRQAWNRRSVNKQWVHARSLVPGQEATKFHTLRAIHATWLLDQGVAELDVAMQLRHIDKDGHPNVELVRKVYGRPSVDAAMGRLRLVRHWANPVGLPVVLTDADFGPSATIRVSPSSAVEPMELPPAPEGVEPEVWVKALHAAARLVGSEPSQTMVE